MLLTTLWVKMMRTNKHLFSGNKKMMSPFVCWLYTESWTLQERCWSCSYSTASSRIWKFSYTQWHTCSVDSVVACNGSFCTLKYLLLVLILSLIFLNMWLVTLLLWSTSVLHYINFNYFPLDLSLIRISLCWWNTFNGKSFW